MRKQNSGAGLIYNLQWCLQADTGGGSEPFECCTPLMNSPFTSVSFTTYSVRCFFFAAPSMQAERESENSPAACGVCESPRESAFTDVHLAKGHIKMSF